MQKISHRRRRGFTLIEILATLLILAIALPAVIALLIGNSAATKKAADRNIASLIIPEAINDIQRIHLIAPNMTGVAHLPEEEGLYISSRQTDPKKGGGGQWPCLNTFGNLRPYNALSLNESTNESIPDLLMWPPRPDSPRYGGQLGGASPTGTSGAPYRVIYKLVRHPNWSLDEDVHSTWTGMYVLTLTVYKDLSASALPSNPGKKMEQVSDPVVVYFRSKSKDYRNEW